MKPLTNLPVFAFLAAIFIGHAGHVCAAEPTEPSAWSIALKSWPQNGEVEVPKDWLPIVRGEMRRGSTASPIELAFNEDASEIKLILPQTKPDSDGPITLWFRGAKKTQQATDGEIVFSAADATVIGEKAKLEQHPGNDRIGFWTNADDYVQWKYKASRWGKYRVLLTYSTAAPDGTEVAIEFGGEQVAGKLPSTGSWYRYRTLDLGSLYLAASGDHALNVRCTKKVGGAVMNLKAVILVPDYEGKTPSPLKDGTLVLHGQTARVRGTMLRYEPAEKKQTLGFWTKAEDAADWKFTNPKAGEFDIEVWQGCGTGQGGSTMQVTVGSEKFPFTVEETGHFQNFKPRIIGRVKLDAGEHQVTIQPTKIAKAAACDVRQIRLAPVVRDDGRQD